MDEMMGSAKVGHTTRGNNGGCRCFRCLSLQGQNSVFIDLKLFVSRQKGNKNSAKRAEKAEACREWTS